MKLQELSESQRLSELRKRLLEVRERYKLELREKFIAIAHYRFGGNYVTIGQVAFLSWYRVRELLMNYPLYPFEARPLKNFVDRFQDDLKYCYNKGGK